MKDSRKEMNQETKNQETENQEILQEQDIQAEVEEKPINFEARDERRKQRKAKRRKQILIQKICFIVIPIVCILGAAIWYYTTSDTVRIQKLYSQAKTQEESGESDQAIATYQGILAIDNQREDVYRYIANLYLTENQYEEAEAILLQGLETTGNAIIADTYSTVMLNQCIKEVNDNEADLHTILRVVQLLEAEPENEKALEILQTCYERIFLITEEDGVNRSFVSDEDGFGYDTYEVMMDGMLQVYESNQNDSLADLIVEYAVVESEKLYLPMEYKDSYVSLLQRVSDIRSDAELDNLLACMEDAEEKINFLTPMLKDFESGNYKAAREFIVSDDYLALRDSFIAENEKYWIGATYIPFSEIGMMLERREGNWGYSFMDEEKEPAKQGYLKVWGFHWVDNGHERTGISYIPVSETGEYYPRKEIEILYWWATAKNQETTENTYAKMNYRFEERTYTAEGMTADVINDWGGSYEYRDTYE